MAKKRVLRAADLFCGAGGTSSGLKAACDEQGIELKLTAINHWAKAIQTHKANHPYAEHMRASLDNLDPKKVIPEGYLDLLVASPECTHFSRARGGRPKLDQKRASPWMIMKWLGDLYVKNVLIENVPEFTKWGPLDKKGKAIKSREGELFQQFIASIKAYNYNVEYKVLNAADYGDPQSRQRLFIIAKKGNQKISWPASTHSEQGEDTFFGPMKKWRTAREIVNFDDKGKSIFERKKPLAANTMRRIMAGLRKFCSKDLEPFLVMMYNTNDARSLDRPCPTVTTAKHIGLCQFLVSNKGKSNAASADRPLPTVTTKDYLGVCTPMILGQQSGAAARPIDSPVPTVSTAGAIALIEPLILKYYGTGVASSIDKPLGTVTTKDRFALLESFIIPNFGERKGQQPRVQSLDKPLAAVTSHGAGALVQPVINGYKLDILYRMLRPRELARAQSFDEKYWFAGKQKDVVAQIGNAVPRSLGKALCGAIINPAKAIRVLPEREVCAA